MLKRARADKDILVELSPEDVGPSAPKQGGKRLKAMCRTRHGMEPWRGNPRRRGRRRGAAPLIHGGDVLITARWDIAEELKTALARGGGKSSASQWGQGRGRERVVDPQPQGVVEQGRHRAQHRPETCQGTRRGVAQQGRAPCQDAGVDGSRCARHRRWRASSTTRSSCRRYGAPSSQCVGRASPAATQKHQGCAGRLQIDSALLWFSAFLQGVGHTPQAVQARRVLRKGRGRRH